MRWRPDDPDHVALRRGIRAAVALPITMAVALLALDDKAGALFAVLGTVGLLVSADFAGGVRQRLTAYLMTGVVGAVLLVIGWAASGTTWIAVVVTLVVAFALGFAAFLRSGVAVGTSAIMLVFVVAITSDADPGDLAQYQLGWWCAVLICTVTALVLLPRNSQSGIREAIAAVFDAAAAAARAAWLGADAHQMAADVAELTQRMDALDRQYGGERPRLPGLTGHDQALDLLVAQLDNTRQLLAEASAPDRAGVASEHDELAEAVIATLVQLAHAMRDPRFLPSAERLDAARGRLRDQLGAWVVDAVGAGQTPREVAARLSEHNPLRMAAVLVEQMTQAARVANHGTSQTLDLQPPIPSRTWRRVVRSQLHPRSPWTRNAARSALALALAVFVVDRTGVEHGFWVLLGTISVLRFDAAATRKLVVPAIVATAVGALLGVVALLAFTDAPNGLWALLPIAVFLAAWSGAALGFAAGQAAFTALVLIAIGIIDWPVPNGLALVRLEDVALGIVVALAVAFLMWPRGAAGELRREMAEATALAGAYLGRAIGSYTSADPSVGSARIAATFAVDRAVETIEIVRAQRGPGMELDPWTRQATSSYVLVTAGRVIASLAPRYAGLPSSPALDAALASTRASSDEHWTEIASAIRESRASGVEPVPGLAPLDLSDVHLRTADEAAAFVLAVWAIDWAAFVSRMPTLTASVAR